MKSIINKDDIIVYIYKNEINNDVLTKDNLEIYIKKIVLKLKQKYLRNISGFYDVEVHINKQFGMILNIIKEDELDFFPDILDLKVTVNHDSDIYLSYEDYFIIKNNKAYYLDNKFYININDLTEKEIIIISEFSTIIYGKELNKIIKQIKQVKT